MARLRDLALAGLALPALLAAGCASGPRPCTRTDACPGSLVCQVGRCTRIEALPAGITSRRRVLEPSALAWVDRESDEGDGGELRLGSARGGGSTMLVRFDTAGLSGEIESAFLVLDPPEGAAPSPSPVELTVSRVVDPWSEAGGGPRKLPRTSPPEARGLLAFSPPQPARIDVTAMARELLREGPSRHHGFAVHAPGGDTTGARFATPPTGGAGARLDVYLR